MCRFEITQPGDGWDWPKRSELLGSVANSLTKASLAVVKDIPSGGPGWWSWWRLWSEIVSWILSLAGGGSQVLEGRWHGCRFNRVAVVVRGGGARVALAHGVLGDDLGRRVEELGLMVV